jgi:hypothetical protein
MWPRILPASPSASPTASFDSDVIQMDRGKSNTKIDLMQCGLTCSLVRAVLRAEAKAVFALMLRALLSRTSRN